MRRLIRTVLALVALLLAASFALYLAAGGDYPVAATVSDDPALPRIEVAGVTLHSETFGPDTAPAIIVLHGGPGGDYRSLLALKALAGRFRVVFYDQRGAGLSQRVAPGALTLQTHLEELTGVIDRVSPDRPVILIGHSWGAMLASAYLGHAPDRVARAVLIEPGMLSAADAEAWQARAKAYMSGPGFLMQGAWAFLQSLHVDGPDPQAGRDFLWGRMVRGFANHPDNPYHCPGAPFDAPGWRFGAVASASVSAQAGPADYDTLGAPAGAFAGPVLLMAGGCDDWLGAPMQRRNLGYYAEARLVVIPEAGHDVIWDAPDPALAAIAAFLAE